MQFFINITLGGIATGMIVASVALGLVLIFRATNVVNFAQGAMAMLSTYIAYAILHQGVGYWLALLAAIGVAMVFGAATHLVLMRPIQHRSPLNAIIVTFGFLILLEGLAGAIWGSATRNYPAPFSESGQQIGHFHLSFSPFEVFTVVAVLVLMALMLFLFRGTSLGLRMRAAAFAPETARLLGVRVQPLLTLGWALASAAGVVAALLVVPTASLTPNFMDVILIYGFTAAVVGGLDSPVGALVGGLLTGLSLAWVGGYLGGSVEPMAALALVIVALMIRPTGIFSPAGTEAGLMGAFRRRVQSLTAKRWFRLPRQPMLRHLTFAVVAGVGFYFATNWLSAFNDYELGQIAFYAVALAGLTVLTGINGQISLGHGGFMAVGAFTFALLFAHTTWDIVVELLVAGAVSAVAGAIIGIPATRLRGPYLAGMTLMVAVGLPYITNQYNNIFGGDQGLTTAAPSGPSDINPEQWLAWFQILAAIVVLVLLGNLMRSRFGRAFRAVRDDEIAASLAGINVARTKVTAFTVSAACAGLGGALLALSAGIVNSAEFPLALSIYLLAGIVLGGTGSLMGVWWGALIVVYLPTDWAQSLANAVHANQLVSANLALLVFGLVLVVVMMVAPSGIQGGLRWVAARITGYLSPSDQLTIALPLQPSAEPTGNNSPGLPRGRRRVGRGRKSPTDSGGGS